MQQASLGDASFIASPSRTLPAYQTQRLPAYPQQVYFSQPPQYPYPPPQFHPSNSLPPSIVYQSQAPIIYQPQPVYQAAVQQPPPQFLIHTLPIVRKTAQQSDYPSSEQVKSLCEGKITELNIFCVLCGLDYRASEKQQHLQKHLRKIQPNNLSALKKPQRLQNPQKPAIMTKPIVQPQEAIAQYDPNVYKIIQQIIYEDEASVDRQEALVGPDPSNSFNYFDNNASLSLGNELIIKQLEYQPNPFFKKDQQHLQEHQYEVSMPSAPQKPLLEELKQHEEREQASRALALSQIHGNTINQFPAVGFETGQHAEAFTFDPYEQRQYASKAMPQAEQVRMPAEEKTQSIDGHISKRFQNEDRFNGFPEQMMKIQEREPSQVYSGPHEILPPTEQSKKSTEMNVSQFIRDLHLESQSLELQQRSKLPYQSQW